MNPEVIVKEDLPFIWITLNRPHCGNAYDFNTATSLVKIFQELKKRDDLHGVILTGTGSHFCTGADLQWMSKASSLSLEENLKDMAIIKSLYQEILTLSIPLIVMAKGKIRGGGVGLVAAADIVLGLNDATFSLSEARLGLIPGIITPILVDKIGRSRFIEMAISGREIDTLEAQRIGLIHQILRAENIDRALQETLSRLKDCSRKSLLEIKESVGSVYKEELFETFWKKSATFRAGEEFIKRVNSGYKVKTP
jgi:methylglutaconyl-CoA hydratase